MRTILRDAAYGTLMSGMLYQFVVPLDFDIEVPVSAGPTDGTPHVIAGRGTWSFWSGLHAELLYDATRDYKCPYDGTHETGRWRSNFRADLLGGPVLCDFVPDFFHQGVIVTGQFWRRLQKSGLTGIRAVPLPIGVNQSTVERPDLLMLDFIGQPCCRCPIVTVPEPNVCPFCTWGPVVCPGCLHISYECRNCRKRIVILPEQWEGEGDTRFVSEPISDEGLVLDGLLWDGSDFIAGADQGFVSRRAVEWLMKEGAAPFAAKPCRVDVGTGDIWEQKRKQVKAKVKGPGANGT